MDEAAEERVGAVADDACDVDDRVPDEVVEAGNVAVDHFLAEVGHRRHQRPVAAARLSEEVGQREAGHCQRDQRFLHLGQRLFKQTVKNCFLKIY